MMAGGRITGSTDDLGAPPASGAAAAGEEAGRSLDASGRSTPQDVGASSLPVDSLLHAAARAGLVANDTAESSPRSTPSAAITGRDDDTTSISSDSGSFNGPPEVRGLSLVAWVQALVFGAKLDEGTRATSTHDRNYAWLGCRTDA